MVEWDLTEDWGPKREAGVNQYAVVRGITFGFGFLAALLFASGLMFAPKLDGTPELAQSPTEELERILQRLRITQDARARMRVIEGLTASSERLAGPLHEILQQPSHELILQAVECAVEFDSPVVRRILGELAVSGSHLVRAAAVESVDQLAPWSSSQLSLFLTEGPMPVRLAALRVSGRRVDVPWSDICALLVSEDELLRDAALNAFPRRPPPEAVRILDRMALSGDDDAAAVALRVLRRTQFAGEYDKVATDLLAVGSSDLQRAALDLLSAMEVPLEEPEVVWALAQDSTVELAVRAKAIYCLERSESYVDSNLDLSSGVDEMNPVLQYFTARCLVRSGASEGADLLLELLESDVPQVAAASRALLGDLTGLGLTASAVRYGESLRELHVARMTMPPPNIVY